MAGGTGGKDIQLPPETESGKITAAYLNSKSPGSVPGPVDAHPAHPQSLSSTVHDGIDMLTHKTPFGQAADILSAATPKP